MKRIFAIACIAVLASCSAENVGKAKKADQEVRQVLYQLKEAQMRNDTATLNSIYADDYTLTEDDGTVFNKAQRIAAIGKIRFETITFDGIQVRVYGNAAVMTYRVGVRFREPRTGPLQFQVTMVYVKSGGQWRVVAGHESFVEGPSK